MMYYNQSMKSNQTRKIIITTFSFTVFALLSLVTLQALSNAAQISKDEHNLKKLRFERIETYLNKTR